MKLFMAKGIPKPMCNKASKIVKQCLKDKKSIEKDLWSHASQITSTSGLSDGIMVCLYTSDQAGHILTPTVNKQVGLPLN